MEFVKIEISNFEKKAIKLRLVIEKLNKIG